MAISKAWRLGGFIAALGASGALIASATGATGAYFTSTHDGTMQATSGHLSLSVSNTTLDFSGLMPGVDQNKTINYTTDVSSGTEDVWLVFPTDTDAQKLAYAEFTGAKGEFGYSDGGLGRFGHFAVSDSHGGLAFHSYNLANDPATNKPDCPADANGRGGSDAKPTSETDTTTATYCGVPKAILLASNLVSGTNGTITVTFGLTGKQTVQNQTEFSPNPVQYQIVGTQHGIRPDAPNF